MKFFSPQTLSHLMWPMFIASCSVFIASLLANVMGITWMNQTMWRVLILGLPALTVFLHAVLTMTLVRAIFFFFLAGGVGFVFEHLGLSTGVIFGGTYTYSAQHITFFGVPLSVILYWAVFSYCGYSIINSFLVWLRKDKPDRLHSNWLQVLYLVLADALVVLIIDIFMDPLMMRQGVWTWHTGGVYFDVPIGNFIGWFLVAAIISACIRILDYVRPLQLFQLPASIHLIPILGYVCIACSLALLGLSLQMYAVVVIGSVLMGGVIVSNLILFQRYIRGPS